MEPGHEDREYVSHIVIDFDLKEPQWSPVMKTGNTTRRSLESHYHDIASMEPGHEDREYPRTTDPHWVIGAPQWSPVMKTGNTCGRPWPAGSATSSLNGARS